MFGIGMGAWARNQQALIGGLQREEQTTRTQQAQREMIAPAIVSQDDAQREYNANVTRKTSIAREMLDGQQWSMHIRRERALAEASQDLASSIDNDIVNSYLVEPVTGKILAPVISGYGLDRKGEVRRMFRRLYNTRMSIKPNPIIEPKSANMDDWSMDEIMAYNY